MVSHYIDIRKSGKSFKARCPFHNEKTPSFFVSPHHQSYHCFGCGAHGDVIEFVKNIENLPFIDAVKTLADRYGIELQFTKEEETSQLGDKFAILEKVNSWFISNLKGSDVALQYLKSRGVSDLSIEKFQLGYLASSQELLDFLKSQYIKFQDGAELGLLSISEDGKRYFSSLYNRIIFPIFNSTGRVVAFGGRTLGNHPAKYINSPNTPFFHKSKIFYGQNFANSSIYKSGIVHIVEGYLDVVMLHQIGIENVIAPLGTALTQEQGYILKKYKAKVNLAFDGDSAGINAIKRALDTLLPLEIETRVTLFENGKDPAQLVQEGATFEDVQKLLDSSQDGVKFYIDQHISGFNLSNPYEKSRAIAKANEVISKLPFRYREEYSKYIDRLLSVGRVEILYNRRIRDKEAISNREFFGYSEVALLRSAIENPKFIDILRSNIDLNDFNFYREHLKDILDGNLESENIRWLLHFDIELLSSKEEFEIEIVNLLIRKFTNLKKDISKNSGMDFQKKVLELRKIQNEINRLNKRKRRLIEQIPI